MSENGISRPELVAIVVKATLVGLVSYFGLKWAFDALDPTRKQKKEAHDKALTLLQQIGVENKHIDLNEYEMSIAAQLVDPGSIETSWDDIAGLTDVIDDIKSTVIFPLKTPELFASSELHQPPKGVLFHGPPGCGKTMLAKATAKAAGARFINLEVPALTDKWYGESQKLAAAVFTLAVKLQPCIIFIDEIDSFLRTRTSHDHEATAMMKAQFMMLWDGLSSSRYCQVVVMGATNRPQDVDKAILRRMPAMFQVGLPIKSKRLEILRLILAHENLDEAVDYDYIAGMTDSFSGSDLKELCRVAAMFRVKELNFTSLNQSTLIRNLRPISMADFKEAVRKMKEAKVLASGRFAVHLENEALD
ncbi:Outer mitochondrial transmembrane helix translocase [Halotydeus destructor]|nr:Outer mitochondrial transmembrane helix translocase [Halotydeus destructor]